MNANKADAQTFLCGIDEAGRGPLAGPVCAAAVILAKDFPCDILNDSKKLSSAAREKARPVICSGSLAWGIGWATAGEIDEINILQASLLAMKRAYGEMIAAFGTSDFFDVAYDKIRVVVDGIFIPDIPVPCEAVVKADSFVNEVMAASILAKTYRDHLMEYYSLLYPEYGYDKHKGYPTKAHRTAIQCYGPSPIQRKSFRVKNQE
ncbi:MAG: ribonuclease HII [Treponema sp.]|nr:ribonuclease HII [Treponema sp.]